MIDHSLGLANSFLNLNFAPHQLKHNNFEAKTSRIQHSQDPRQTTCAVNLNLFMSQYQSGSDESPIPFKCLFSRVFASTSTSFFYSFLLMGQRYLPDY